MCVLVEHPPKVASRRRLERRRLFARSLSLAVVLRRSLQTVFGNRSRVLLP